MSQLEWRVFRRINDEDWSEVDSPLECAEDTGNGQWFHVWKKENAQSGKLCECGKKQWEE